MAVFFSAVAAHMSVTPAEITPGGREAFGLTISHDCGTDAIGTTNFTIGVPEGLVSVKVEDTPGWHAILHKVPLDPPVVMGTTQHNETVISIEFHGFLPEDFYKTFGVRVQALDTLEVGATLYWSGYQECHGEEETIAWATIPSDSDPEPRYPAVPITVVADKGDGSGRSGHSGAAGKSATTSATLAPTTEAPASDAPATEAPATQAGTTEAPAAEAPATEAPVTEAPVTEAPVTEAPVIEAATEAPATEAPATEAPLMDHSSHSGHSGHTTP
jgi:uncharacterized protein YcnI